jgi:hypothetical protein
MSYKNGDEVGDCSFTDMQAKDIEEKLGDIIEKAFTLKIHARTIGTMLRKICHGY